MIGSASGDGDTLSLIVSGSNFNESSAVNNISNFSTPDTYDPCAYSGELFIQDKMILIVGFGSWIALMGLITNGILMWLFFGHAAYRSTHMLYLGALAVYDSCICLCFIMLFSVKVLYDYIECRWLFLMFHEYVRATYTLTRIVQTASTYMIIAATTERFFAVGNFHSLAGGRSVQGNRLIVIGAILSFAILSRISTFFELTIQVTPQCNGTFAYKRLTLQHFARQEPYSTVYLLYFNHILHIFLPFVLLLCLNLAILIKLRAALRLRTAMVQMALGSSVARQRKESLKAATRTLVAIVTAYLACNVLGFALTMMEHIDINMLYDNMRFYTFASDAVSLLHVTNASIRLFIYLLCNNQIRKTLRERLCCGMKRMPNDVGITSMAIGGLNGYADDISKLTNVQQSPTPYIQLPLHDAIVWQKTSYV